MAKMYTDDELKTLREITARVQALNTAVQDADKAGYVVELLVEKTKPGYPRLRYRLLRGIGG